MKLNYNEKELHQLLQDFHDLTKLTLTLYDPEGEWILSYPTKENCFCHYIKTSPEGAALCDASDRASFEAAKASGECVIYKCHAGLIEATAPIVSDGFTIGYLMMGQVANATSPEQLQPLIEHALHKYHLSNTETNIANSTSPDTNEANKFVEYDNWKQYANAIPCISDTQIHAAASIMEACISSILYKKLISIEKQQFEQNINTYILNKPPQDLRILGRIFTLQHRQIHKKNAPAACADTINQNKFTNFYHFRTMRIFRLQLFLSGFQAGKWHVRTKLSHSTTDIIFL